MNKNKSSGLGRGLGALLQASNISLKPSASTSNQIITNRDEFCISYIKLDDIEVGKYQPRRVFANEEIEDLANSIKLNGIIQPIVVRKINHKFEIVAGERRYRAAKLAKLEQIPVIIRQLTDTDTLAIALIENIQRKDLNLIEEAMAYTRLMQEFNLTQDDLSNTIGKSRSYIANIVRLLNLDMLVQDMLVNNQITMGHARALLTLEPKKQVELAKLIIEKGLTTKKVEQLVVNIKNDSTKKPNRLNHVELVDLENKLSDSLGMSVKINHKPNGGGKITISYSSLDEVDCFLKNIL